jgi:hypothetical protein
LSAGISARVGTSGAGALDSRSSALPGACRERLAVHHQIAPITGMLSANSINRKLLKRTSPY